MRLAPATQRAVSTVVVGRGTLAADESALLAFKVPGRISAIEVDLGSSVRKGGVIARLDTTDYQLRVQQAQAALQQARVRLGLDPGGTSNAVNPESTGTVRQARAVLEEARLNRERGLQLVQS